MLGGVLWVKRFRGWCRPVITVTPVVLEANGIRLEPMTVAHHASLSTAAADGELWNLWFTAVPAPGGMQGYIAAALQGQRDGHMLPWVVRDLPTGTVIGTTRYHDIMAGVDRFGNCHPQDRPRPPPTP